MTYLRRTGLRLAGHLRRLVRNTSGMALIEMAYVTPVILILGLGGFEIANLAAARMKVSQLALSVADNASRLGQTDNSGITPTIKETDVDAVIDGAMRAGGTINLAQNGRIIISSIEYDAPTFKRYIHWQRCRGALAMGSRYGNDSNRSGLTGPVLPPLGRGTTKFTVTSGQALMLVEIYYNYDGLVGTYLLKNRLQLAQEAGLLVRDDRNLGPGLTGGGSRSPCLNP